MTESAPDIRSAVAAAISETFQPHHGLLDCDVFLTRLWIEGFKVVELSDADKNRSAPSTFDHDGMAIGSCSIHGDILVPARDALKSPMCPVCRREKENGVAGKE